MKMKLLLSLGVFAAVLALNLYALAGSTDEVVFEGQPFCINQDDCQNFALWGGETPAGYVVLYEADGHTISDYLWVDPTTGLMTFESDLPGGGFAKLPPAGLPFFGGFIEDGTLQQVNQLFPGGGGRPLFIESSIDTPEPSTLLLLGPAAVFLFGRARRLWRT
jgi:hypothetical protein